MISQRVQHPQAKYFIGEFMNDGRRNLKYIQIYKPIIS